MIKTLTPALALTLMAAGFAQSESRELDAHQHGHGTLNIAFEGAVLVMELEVPGADIVGFEHPAENAEDRALIDAAIADLAKPLDLFVMPADAGCTVTAAAASLEGEDDHDDHHGEHKGEHKEDHADHAEKHDDDHADHADAEKDDHDHDKDHADHADEGAEESHTEFHAEYTLACVDPSAIDVITFAYFERFPNAQELDIQMISDKGAKGFEVESDDPQLDLSGAI